MLILYSFFLLITNVSAEDLKRKILVFNQPNDVLSDADVHRKIEAILNYYGYFPEYISIEDKVYPSNIDDYVGFIYWNYSNISKNPLKLTKYLTKFKNKKNMIIGELPYVDNEGKSYFKETNKLLRENFGFTIGKTWSDRYDLISQEYDKNLFGFEKKVSFLTNIGFLEVQVHNKDIKTVFKETFENTVSHSAFFAPWGFFGQISKVFYNSDEEGKNRWIINPFKLIEKVYSTNYPIPDTTTKNGKRIAYLHIDGDGILSKSFNQKYTIANGLDFIKEQKLKTGVSFIAVELDKDGPLLKNSKHNVSLLNEKAKAILNLPFVEPASHTYTHPFNWREGMVAYSGNKNAKKVLYDDHIKAFQEEDKQINLEYEIDKSINYIQKLIPNKKITTLYWTGDCYPSLRDIEYVNSRNILAFNGGDSRFDSEFNSYSYVTALGLYNKKGIQIYSSNSNENTYTNDWSDNFWRFKNLITILKKTAYPKRIKPVNVYYHFYSFEKKASFNALRTIYSYIKTQDYEYIYPSEFIKIARNFYDLKIEQLNINTYKLSNIKELKEFRLEGNKKVRSDSLEHIKYDKKLDVTYFRLKNNVKEAIVEIFNKK
jgi:hypothetical protein